MIRMTFASLMIFFATQVPFFAHAGIVKENGGNTVVCHSDEGATAELLDFYEAAQILPPDDLHFTFWKDRTESDVLSFILQTIGYVRGAAVAEMYGQWLSSFTSEANFIAGVQLGTVHDSYHFLIPRGCEVVQTVLQIEPIFHEARYTINADAWNSLPPLHQVGLMVHELIYRDLNFEDSRSVRLITAFLFSDEIQHLNLQQQKEALVKMGFTSGSGIRNTDRRPN